MISFWIWCVHYIHPFPLFLPPSLPPSLPKELPRVEWIVGSSSRSAGWFWWLADCWCYSTGGEPPGRGLLYRPRLLERSQGRQLGCVRHKLCYCWGECMFAPTCELPLFFGLCSWWTKWFSGFYTCSLLPSSPPSFLPSHPHTNIIASGECRHQEVYNRGARCPPAVQGGHNICGKVHQHQGCGEQQEGRCHWPGSSCCLSAECVCAVCQLILSCWILCGGEACTWNLVGEHCRSWAHDVIIIALEEEERHILP